MVWVIKRGSYKVWMQIICNDSSGSSNTWRLSAISFIMYVLIIVLKWGVYGIIIIIQHAKIASLVLDICLIIIVNKSGR